MKIGFKIKYPKNVNNILPDKNELQEMLDFFEFGIRLNEDYQEYKKLIKNTNLFVTLHGPAAGEGVNLANAQKNDFNKKNIELCQKAADFFNAEIIVLHPGFKANRQSNEENIYFNLTKYTDKRFVVENVPSLNPDIPYKRFGINTKELLKIKEKTNRNICLDFGHALLEARLEKRDFYQFIKEAINKLSPSYYHLSGSDGKCDRHWHITHPQNIIRYEELLPLLPRDSLLTLEINIFDNKKGFDKKYLIEDIKYLKQILSS
jgi:sugar phosphate isomerase/epimerase